MKKVINITLGSVVFAIEQDAYDTLAVYLDSVKERLQAHEDASEIVADIEGALAEKFLAKKRNEKHAVTTADVSIVVEEMGTPDDFAGEEPTVSEEVEATKKQQSTKKRLYRDTDDAVIAGVASGLASYFDVDPVIVRIIFFVSIFFNGLGLFAYIVLWLVVPKAQTTTEKYAMRGEAVTLREITQRVKKNVEKVDTQNLPSAQSAWSGLRPVFVKLFAVLGICVRAVLKIAQVLAGAVLLFGGAVALAGLVSAYSIVLLSEKTLLPLEAQTAVDIMVSSTLGIVAMVASFVMMTIPLLVAILVGASLLMKRNLFTAAKSISLAVVWIVAAVLAVTASTLQLERVFQELGIDEHNSEGYQIHINVTDDYIDFDTQVLPVEDELVPSLPPEAGVAPLPPVEPVACTMDAKECPDGSYVGRSGPNCAFAACPES